MLKVGVIGLGMMGQSHLLRLIDSPLATVTAVADPIPGRLAGTTVVGGNLDLGQSGLDMGDVVRYSDGADLIREADVEVVWVCLPTPLHAPMSILAAENGKHVFCEKPMARTVEQADGMIAAAKANGVGLMIGQCVRFWPEFGYLKERVEDGVYGKLRSLRMSRVSSCPTWSADGWLLDSAKSGGTTVDMHIHDIDTVRWICGQPRAVQAHGWNQNCTNGIDVIDSVLDYGPELAVKVTGGWLDMPSFGFEASYDALFEGALVRYNGGWERTLVVYPSGGGEPLYPEVSGDAYVREVDHFLRCVSAGKDPGGVIEPEEARDSLALVLALESSARIGEPVVID